MQAIAPIETFFDREPLAADPEYQWCLGDSGIPKDPLARSKLIEREVNRLIPLVARHLDDVGVPTTVGWTESEPRYTAERGNFQQEREVKLDLIEGCLDDEAHGGDRRASSIHHRTMAALEQGIGIYEYLADRAIPRWWNPVYWIGGFIRFPLTVLEAAGIVEDKSLIVKGYGWLIQGGVLLLVLLLARMWGLEGLVRDIIKILKGDPS
jgi:hypothetical protein